PGGGSGDIDRGVLPGGVLDRALVDHVVRNVLEQRTGTAGERVRCVDGGQPGHGAVAVERGQQPGPCRVPPGGAQPGQRNVGAQVLVAADAVGEIEPGLGEPGGVRPFPGGDQYQVGDDVLAVVEGQPPAVAPPFHLGDPATEPGFHAGTLVCVGDQGADGFAEGAVHQAPLGVDDDRPPGESADGAGGFAAGQSAADDG